MSDENKANASNVNAENNSIAIGGLQIDGDVSGNITIGNTTGYTAEQVSVLITRISSTFQPKPFDGHCPYKGLDVFEEEDAELFFGREKLVDDLVGRVKESRTVFVTGPSGSGKSSLVRAGLIHALKQGKTKGSERWLYETIKPGRDPIGELGRVASSLAGSTNAEDEIRAKAMGDATIFARWCEITLKEGRDKRLVLFIDQFEEVFTQINNEEERVAFLNLLTHAATIENGRVIILFSMRSDFVSNCATYPQLNALLNQQFVQIGAMQPEELVSAIAQPALRVGLRIDPDLIAQIINEMKGEPGALPLMQFALKDLFDSQQEKSGVIALTLNDYLQRGGIHKALERHADDSFSKLNKNEQELARSIFSGLIEIGRGTQDTKRTAMFDELVPANSKAEEVEAIVQKLADARLVTTDEAAGNDTVTISHEKLIDAWPWLKKLVNENRDAIALQNEITSDAKEWDGHKRDTSYLYMGGRLANVREQLEKQKFALSHLAQEFVRAGRVKQRRTQGLLSAAVSIVLIASIVASVIFQKQAQESQANAEEALKQAKIARAGELAAVSNANLDLDPELSLHLAVQSISDSYTLQGEDALRRALLSPPVELTLDGHSGAVYSVAYDHEGKRLVTASEDGTARIWDAATGREKIILLGHTGDVYSASFSPNGQLIATGGADKTVRIWSADTGKLIRILDKHADIVYSVAFSPDGQRLVTGSKDKTARVWDVASGNQVLVLTHTVEVRAVTFSPLGTYIATGGYSPIITVWSAITGQSIQSFDNSPEYVTAFAFSPNEQYLLINHLYSAIRLDIESGQILREYDGLHTWYLSSVAFSPDGQQVVTASSDHTLGIWDTESGNLIEVLRGHSGTVYSARFDPSGDHLATASEDQTVRIWNIAEWRKRVLIGYSGYISTAVYSPNGQRIATAGNDGMIRVWDVSTKRELKAWQYPSWINRLHFSPDNQQLITSSDNGTWQIWDAATGQQLYESEPAPFPFFFTDVRFNQDGTGIITTGRDGLAIIWDAKTKQQLITLSGHQNGVWSGMFSADGQLAVTAGADGTARLWNAQTGEQLHILNGHGGLVGKVAFNSNGTRIVTASVDNTARIWDTNTGQQLFILKGHTRELSEAVFSPDDQYVATASRDHIIILWNANTGDEIIRLFGHNQDILSLTFSPDGRNLLTASEDGTVRIYPVYFQDVLILAQTLLSPRELTCAERLKYLHEQCPTPTP